MLVGRFLVVFDGSKKSYYLYGGEDAWFVSSTLESGWKFVSEVPPDVAALGGASPTTSVTIRTWAMRRSR